MNPRLRTKRFLRASAVAVLTLCALPLCAKQPRSDPDVTINVFGNRIPLGIEGFFVRPVRRTLYVMGTARSTFFQGWQLRERDGRRRVETADGIPVQYFPRSLSFRITATALVQPLLQVDRDFLDNVDDLNRYLLQLGFRIRIFHGLQVKSIEPERVEVIGMPADIPYEERVYRASFILPEVPIEDRIVLEVLNPDGERLCKFHLDF